MLKNTFFLTTFFKLNLILHLILQHKPHFTAHIYSTFYSTNLILQHKKLEKFGNQDYRIWFILWKVICPITTDLSFIFAFIVRIWIGPGSKALTEDRRSHRLKVGSPPDRLSGRDFCNKKSKRRRQKAEVVRSMRRLHCVLTLYFHLPKLRHSRHASWPWI
jgi:hypothetical protein